MIVWLTPSMIDGFAMGSCTFRSVWRGVEPNESGHLERRSAARRGSRGR